MTQQTSSEYIETISKYAYTPRAQQNQWSEIKISLHKDDADIISEYAKELGVFPRDIYRAIIAHAADMINGRP